MEPNGAKSAAAAVVAAVAAVVCTQAAAAVISAAVAAAGEAAAEEKDDNDYPPDVVVTEAHVASLLIFICNIYYAERGQGVKKGQTENLKLTKGKIYCRFAEKGCL